MGGGGGGADCDGPGGAESGCACNVLAVLDEATMFMLLKRLMDVRAAAAISKTTI